MINCKKFVVLIGEGGVGKSAIARDFISQMFEGRAGFIFIKADVLDRSSLAQSLAELGVHSSLETLLAQWIYLPRLVIYIDSFEKLYETSNKEAFLELINLLKKFQNISLIATCRSYAFETVQRKFRIKNEEVGTLHISKFSDTDLQLVVEARPQLAKLISNRKLKKLISIPYYLDLAFGLTDNLDEQAEINEKDFKNAIWEQLVQKKGLVKAGHGNLRGKVFSKIVLKRATEKQSYISSEEGDMEVVGELVNDELLTEHPSLDRYAPAHDILEDMVVVRYLDLKFEDKENSIAFIQGVDTNPVMRRGVRLWIQDLILSNPKESKIFLQDVLEDYTGSTALLDELLVGILGSEECLNLLSLNRELVLANDMSLFFRLFHLAKVAYSIPRESRKSSITYRSFGPGWDALLVFTYENFELNSEAFDIILLDLLKHWVSQFEQNDLIPDNGKIVADFCFKKIQNTRRSVNEIKEVLEVLFNVIPVAETEVYEILLKTFQVVKGKSEEIEPDLGLIRILRTMLLVETYLCENVYKFFPDFIIELAISEWISNTVKEKYSCDYWEASFGLSLSPDGYFSPSANQTPFKYLFKYHQNKALNFLIELTNRCINHYQGSSDAKRFEKVEVELDGKEKVEKYGSVDLWATYRGAGFAPYLIQSALMAFENDLLERASGGENLQRIFDEVIEKSNSVLLIGVLASVAIAYPLIFGEKVFSLLRVKEFIQWDRSRLSKELGSNLAVIGNDKFYTSERHESNQLKHRKQDLEILVTKLQFLKPQEINQLIDDHLKACSQEDKLWKLALIRMDIRNTTPELKEDEGVIAFVPQPLPDDLQKMLDSDEQSRNQSTKAMSIFMWADRHFKKEFDEKLTIEEWREKFLELIEIDTSKVMPPVPSRICLSAVGLKFLVEELSAEEKKFCAEEAFSNLEALYNAIILNERQRGVDPFTKPFLNVFPKLVHPKMEGVIDQKKVKNMFLTTLLLTSEEENKVLVQGVRDWLWGIDQEFAGLCFQVFLRSAYQRSISSQVAFYQTKGESERTNVIVKIINELIEGDKIEATGITFVGANKLRLAEALSMIPSTLLSQEYLPFLDQVILQLISVEDLEDYEEIQFKNKFMYCIGSYLAEVADKGSRKIVLRLLTISKKHFNFFMGVFKWVTATSHDRQYPSVLWEHYKVIFYYVLKREPKVGFIHTILLESISYPSTAFKLPAKGDNWSLHEEIISNFGADVNIITAVFKLLSGAGSVYQPHCIKWLMKGIPSKESYKKSLRQGHGKVYFEEFVQQLYNDHVDFIKRNKDQLEYFIMMLDVLVDFGSTSAFRIRDEVI